MPRHKKKRELVGMYEVLEAVESAIKSAALEEQRALAEALTNYCHDFPDEFFWATGPQAPTLLNHLMMAVTPEGREHSKQFRADAIVSKTTGNA